MLKIREQDVENSKGIADWAARKFPNGEWTLQEYVRNPATYRGRKFDVRVWSIVTGIDALRIYTLEHGFSKISTVDYDPSEEHFSNICMHVKMPLGPKCSASKLIKPYPGFTEGDMWESGLQYKEESGVSWKRDIWPQVEDQVSIAVVSSLEKVRDATLAMFDGDSEATKRYKRFVFLSPDFVIDDSGKVFMEEMNTNGFMVGDTYKDFFPAQESTVLAVRMLGADKYPDSLKYKPSLDRVISNFCSQHYSSSLQPNKEGCNSEDVAELENFVHQEMHAGEWVRSFPPRESDWPGMEKVEKFWKLYSPGATKKSAANNGSPSELDLLTWKFIEFRRSVSTKSIGDAIDGVELDNEMVEDVLKICVYCREKYKGESKTINYEKRQWWT